MKKSSMRIAVLTVIIILITGIQSLTYSQAFIGLTGGADMFKIKGSTFGGINYKFGASAGAILGFKLKTDLNFQFEFLYTQKGMSQQFSQEIVSDDQGPGGVPITYDTSTKYSNKLNLTYIEVPILLKKSFSFKGGIFPYRREQGVVDLDIFAGPYIGYLLSASGTFSSLQSSSFTQNDSLIFTTPETENVAAHSFRIGQGVGLSIQDSNVIVTPDQILAVLGNSRSLSTGLSKIDAGIIFGAGLSVEVGPKTKLFVDARYSMGLLTIDKTYFSNDKYVIKSGGSITVGATKIKATVTHSKIDLKNTGMAVHFGLIHYVK